MGVGPGVAVGFAEHAAIGPTAVPPLIIGMLGNKTQASMSLSGSTVPV